MNTTGLTMTVNGTPDNAWTTLPNTTLRTATIPLSGLLLRHWTVKITGGKLDPNDAADVLLLVKYTAQ